MKRFIYAAGLALATVTTGFAVTTVEAEAGDWKRCTHEGGYCNSNEYFTHIRYGHGKDENGWKTLNRTSGIECSNHAFGKDPKPGTYKHCYVYVPDWEKCTHEGGYCKNAKLSLVRYGTDPHKSGSHIERNVGANGGIECSNHAFGKDPVPGSYKHCWVFR